jgi:hypothetical protein
MSYGDLCSKPCVHHGASNRSYSCLAAAEGFSGVLLQVFHMIKGPEALMTPNLVMKALISRLLRAVKGHT